MYVKDRFNSHLNPKTWESELRFEHICDVVVRLTNDKPFEWRFDFLARLVGRLVERAYSNSNNAADIDELLDFEVDIVEVTHEC